MKLSKDIIESNLKFIEQLKKEIINSHNNKKEFQVEILKTESDIILLKQNYELIRFYFRGLLFVDYIIDMLIFIVSNIYFYYKLENSGEFYLNFANNLLILIKFIKYKHYLVEQCDLSLVNFIKYVKDELYLKFCRNNKKLNKEFIKINKKLDFELILNYYEFNQAKERYLNLKNQLNYYYSHNGFCNFFLDFELALQGKILYSNLNDNFDINYIFNEMITEVENFSLEKKLIKYLNLNLNNIITLKIKDFGIKFIKERVELPFNKIVTQSILNFKKSNEFRKSLDFKSYRLYLKFAKLMMEKKKLFKQYYVDDLHKRWRIKLKKMKISEKKLPFDDFIEYNINKRYPFYWDEMGELFLDLMPENYENIMENSKKTWAWNCQLNIGLVQTYKNININFLWETFLLK